jgi:membrane-associated phospholipid phosphatase
MNHALWLRPNTLGILLTSSLVFLLAWYDTAHGHILTEALNTWVLHSIYMSPDVSGKLPELYNEILLGITALGSDIILLLMLVVISADLLAKKEYKMLLYGLCATVLIFVLAELCKQFIDSPRPLSPSEHDSFPSGHVVRAGVWCGIILLLNQVKIYRLSYCWCALLWVVPLLVAYSRLGLGRHWLSDVIAGLALCVAVFISTGYIMRRADKNSL